MPVVADAAVRVRGDLSQFNRDIATGGEKGARTLSDKIKGAFSPRNLAVAGIGAGIAIGSAVVAGLADATRALIDIERLNAQTDAALKSTGGVANVTREDIEGLSESMESLTTVERETVQEGANLLLTFKRIRNEAGEGNNIFDRATETALDLSVALGTDMRSASMMLGKALDDPIRGVTALRRAGVALTAQQQEQVKAFVEAGDTLSAQRIILEELETQVAGSAEAFADTTAGKIQRFQNDVGNAFESIVLGAVEVGSALGELADDGGDSVDILALHFGDLGDRANGLAGNVGHSFDDIKRMVRERMELTGENVDEALTAIERRFNQSGEEITTTATEAWAATASAFADGEPAMTEAAETTLRDPVIVAMLGGKEEAERIASETPSSIAQALLDNQFSVEDAAASLARTAEEALHPLIERSQIIAFLSSAELAEGLASGVPAVAQRARELKEAAEARLAELSGSAWHWGNNAGTSFAAGMNAAYGWVVDAAGNLAAATRNQIGIESEPRDHNSPLYGITKWGGNIVKTIAEGIYGQLSTGTAAANALAGSLIPSMPVGTPLAAGVAGETRVYQLYVDGKEKVVGAATDVLNAWEQMEGF